MSKFSRALGKGLTGAAEVAVPAAFAQQQKQIQTARDERLQSYSKENSANERAFRTEERLAGEEFTAGENILNREQQTGERKGGELFASGEASAERGFREDLFNQEHQLRRDEFDSDEEYRSRVLDNDEIMQSEQLKQLDLAIASGQLSLAAQQQLVQAQTDYFDAETLEERESILEKLMPDPDRQDINKFSFPVISSKDPSNPLAEIQQVFKADRTSGNMTLMFTSGSNGVVGAEGGSDFGGARLDSGTIPTITSQAQFDELNSGDIYIEDGQRYRK